MSKTWKQILSMVLAVVMVVGNVPMGVFAADADTHTHDYASEVTTPAGCTEEGVLTHTCSCGYSYTEAIPATGHSYIDGLCACGAEEPTQEPEEDEAVVAARALIAALPESVTTDAERDAVWAVMDVVEELSDEQEAQLDMDRYNAAVEAAAAYANPEYDDATAWAEADGWYWVDNTLYIKDGSITQSQFYLAIAEKYGSGTYRYAVSLPNTSTFWTGAGVDVDSSSTNTIAVSRGDAAVGKKGNTNYKDWFGWGANSTTNTFIVEYYYAPTVTVSGKEGVTASDIVGDHTTPGGASVVYHGDSVSFDLSAAGEDDWVAVVATNGDATERTVPLNKDSVTTVTVEGIDSVADSQISVTLKKEQSYTVTTSSNNDNYGTISLTADSGIKNTEVTVTVTPVGKNSAVVSVTEEGTTLTDEATDANGVYTAKFIIGEENVTINAEFRCLSGSNHTNVFFNTHSSVGVAGQMNGGNYFAHVADEQKLEEEIFDALGITYSHAPDGFDWDDVTIKYYPRIEHVISDNEWSEDAYALNEKAPDDEVVRDTYPKDFYERGINQTEKVQISYAGLIFDATIHLVEGRSSELPAVTAAAAESKNGADGIIDAAMEKALDAYSGYTETALTGAAITTEDWLASVNALATGETETVTVRANFAGDATYQAGTVDIDVTVTKSATLPAVVSYTEDEAAGGTVVLTKKDGTAVDTNGVFTADGPVTVTVTPVSGVGYGYYVESIVVNGNDELTITYNNGVATASFDVVNSESETKEYTVAVTYGKIELAAKDSTVYITGWHGANGNDRSYALADVKAEYTTANFLDAGNTKVVEGAGTFKVYMYFERVGDDWLNVQSLGTSNYNFLNTNTTYPVKITWTPTNTAKYPTVTSNEVTASAVEARRQPSITPGTFDNTAKYNTFDLFKEAVKTSINVTYTDDESVVQSIGKDACGLDVQFTLVENTTNQYSVKAKATVAGENWLANEDYITLGTYTFTYNQYTAKFIDADDFKVNGENVVLYTTTINNESTPEYAGETTVEQLSTIHDTDEWDYTFSGWSPAISALNGEDVTYTATYSSEKQTYTITWVNGDETTTTTVAYGEMPVAPAATKTSTAQYHFTNGTWGTIAKVTGDATYTATFTENLRSYTITFYDEDGETVLQTGKVAYGTVPAFTEYDTDELASGKNDAQYTVTWKGWNKEVVAVTGEAEYTATYNRTVNEYTITYYDTDGTTVLHTATYDYNGAIAEYTPSKDNHAFGGWKEGEVPANMPGENLTFTVKEWVANAYQITWNVDGVLNYSTEKYGDTVTLPPAPDKSGYDFAGWDVNGTVCNAGWTMGGENVTATATWTKCVAEVNGEDYTTWTAAYNAANNGDTIKLLDNITLTSKFTVAKAITIDGQNQYGFVANNASWSMSGSNYHLLGINSSNVTLKNITLDSNKQACGVNVYKVENVVLDNVTIKNHNSKKYNAALTVNGSVVTLTGKYAVENCTTSAFDAADGTLTVAEGTIFDYTCSTGNVSAASDLKAALNTEGEPFFVGYAGNTYYTKLTTIKNGLVLLKNATLNTTVTLTGNVTINLAGKELTIADSKEIKVGQVTSSTNKAGTLTVTGEGTISGNIVLWQETSKVVGSEELPVSVPAAMADYGYKVIYADGEHSFGTTITWVTAGGTTTEDYIYGETPSFKGNTDKEADVQYTYTFAGWSVDGETVEPLPAVEAAVTYTAQYTSTVNKYTVTFQNWDGTVLQTGEVEYGTVPTAPADPTKTGSDDITYTFAGWDNEIVAVTGGVTYTAQYSGELKASDGTVAINGYYESNWDSKVFDTLKADTLKAAGLSGKASDFNVVYVTALGNVDLDDFGFLDGSKASFFTTVEVPESGRQVIITHSSGVSKTVTMKITDSRSSAGLVDTEITEIKVLNDQQGLTDYVNGLANGSIVNPKGVTVTVTLTEGTWPPEAAGITTKLVYTVKYADSAEYIGDEAKLTVYVQSSYNNCTVVPDSTLTEGGSLTVNPSNDNTTVAGNDTVTITVTPSGSNVVETITVLKNDKALATYTTDKISYNNKAATVSFESDGSVNADVYTVAATYSQNYLDLKADQTIVYCVDDTVHTYDLQKLVFDAIFGGSSAPMTKDNVKLEFKYGHIVVDLWADVSKDPAINLNGISHKFGESGSETIKLTYSDAKYGSFEQQIALNVFDSCYSSTVSVETKTNGANATIKTQFSEDARKYLGVSYFKAGSSLTVTLTPDGAFLDTLKQMYNGTFADSMAYIESVTVYDKDGNVVEATLTRDQGKLSLEGILQGVNPMLYNAAVTFDVAADQAYKIVVEYGILELDAKNSGFQMEMYKGGKEYAAKVPSAQDIINAVLGEDEAADFLATYGGAFTVDFSTDLISYSWTAVSDEALLALNDGTEIKVRITWKPLDGNKTYYPVADTANITLVDLRTPTSVQGSVPTEKVEYVEENQLIANLKKAIGTCILANGSTIDVDYTVSYTISGDDENGYFAEVTVSYDGSATYKPTSKTFENVPVADIPDNATIKVTIQNASDVVTNNDGKIQALDPATGMYTVIGNGTYNFKFTPVSGKAIESVTVNGVAVELTYSKQVATFSMLLTEKEHYEVVVETVDSVWVQEDERLYDFAYGITVPNNSDIVDAAVLTPNDESIDYSNVSVEYLARTEGKVTVSLPDIDLGFIVIPLGTFDVDLGELWLNPEETTEVVTEAQLDKILENLVDDVISKVGSGELAANNALTYIQDYIKGLPLGIHSFGAGGDGSTETIRISYEDNKYLLDELVTDITIHDYRIATELVANDCEVSYGYSVAQLLAASGAYVSAEGAAVGGLAITTKDLYLHANTTAQEVTLYFAGDATYQPCSVTINVVVNKAACDIDYDSQTVTYGDSYDLSLSVVPTVLPDGTTADIDRVEFMIGLDMHTLLDVDFEDKTVGLDKAVAYVQLRLPQSIRELPLVGQYLQGEFTLGEFTDLINSLDDALGIDAGSMEILNQVLGAITGISDNLEMKIIIKDEAFHPTNIGVYIAGAVTVDADFETAYTADYLIIAPKTVEAQLAWDYTDENGIMTLPAYQQVYAELMGAHVVETETMTGETLETANGHIKYLVLGVNDENSEFLTTDIYGNIKANIWAVADEEGLAGAINDNGAYVQIAYMLNWGNEIYYAMPIVRSFVIVPGTLDVQLVGTTGEPNNELLKEFNNEPQGFSVEVTENGGEMIFSDHYQNIVELPETDEVTYTYIGVQTNGKTYNSSEKPVHAGVYAVAVTYIQKDEDGNLKAVGADMGLLVIEPTESTIDVGNVIIKHEDKTAGVYNIAEYLQINAGSTVEGLTPDTTIITASIATDGDFSENGWDAVAGKVNVDFPKWIEEFLGEHAPDVMSSGITVGTLAEKLGSRKDAYAQLLADAGATEEVVNAFSNLITNIVSVLDKLPEELELSFKDTEELTAQGIGAYVVIGIVSDSDHYPSVDAGILAIVPDVDQVFLKWNYEDSNGVFTRELLSHFDLYATAYDDAEFTVEYTDKEYTITYQFIGIDANGNLVVSETAEGLANGVYTELAYVEFEVAGEMVISDLIARPVVIVPSTVKVDIVDANENDVLLREFNNEPQDVELEVSYEGEVVTPSREDVDLSYIGVQTNGKTYNSSTAPIHAGAYVVTAIYVQRDQRGNVIAAGADTATLVITPTTANVLVEEKVVTVKSGVSYNFGDIVHATSKVPTINPDTTVISAYVGSDGTYSENGWSAAQGKINVDFPKWIDEILAKYATSVKDGITASEFASLVLGRLPAISDKLAEQGISAEVIDTLNKAVSAVADEIAKLPDNASLSFEDDVTVTNVGVYLVSAVVTDSDHFPAADIGYLVILPEVTEVKLEWNYEDENNIWTHEKLKTQDLLATAFDRETGSVKNDAATAKISYSFVGINSAGIPVIYTFAPGDDMSVLPNGVYTESAYIELEIDGQMIVSDMIARTVIITATPADVVFIDETGAENSVRRFVFDNTAKKMDVKITIRNSDTVIVPAEGDLVFTYSGVQTNGINYVSNTAPKHAGVYIVTAEYTPYDASGELEAYGVAYGMMAIEPADSTISVTGDTVTYDGKSHTAEVTVTGGNVKPDYTLISGGAYVTGNIDEIGVDAFRGTVNIDFPNWLDARLEEYEFKTEGVDSAYVIDFISSYRDDLIALIPVDELVKLGVDENLVNEYIDKLNAHIDQLLAVLDKLPKGVALTFEDDVTYTEPGYYFYYGIVTDSDHYPSDDTGLLVIEKLDMVLDLLDTTVTWDGQGHLPEVNNPQNADYVTVVIDRENNEINLLIDEDAQYLLNSLARVLGFEFDGDVQMSTIIEKYSGKEVAAAIVKLLGAAENLGLSEEVQKVLNAVKTELETLPESGTVTVNGELPSEVGEYEVYALSYSVYYKTVSTESVLEILPVRVEVVLDDNSKVYGEADSELTYSVYYYDHEGNALADAGIADVQVSREAGEDVGSYAITAVVTLDDESHYELIAEPEAAVFEITEAELTITLKNNSKVYGDADPELGYTVEGLVNGDTDDELNIVVSREAGEASGSYVITATASNANYNITVVDATFTIMNAVVTVEIDNRSKVYGDADPELTYTIEGLVNGEELVLNLDREEGENVGQYAISAEVAAVSADVAKNYDIFFSSAKLTITKADVKVTVGDYEKTYGDKDPEFEASVEGLKFNDTLTTLISRVPGENVGQYDITVAWTENDNYNITAETGVLTIKKAKVDVTILDDEVTYGDEIPAVKLQYSDERAEDELNISMVWNAKKGSDVGTYGTNFTWINYQNWIVHYNPGELTIVPKPITDADVTLGDALTYNGTEQIQTVDKVVIDGMEATFDVSGNTGTNAGEYTMTVTGTGNFTGSVKVPWTIEKAYVVITVLGDSITYGDKTPEVRVSYSDELAKDEVVYDIVWDAPEYPEIGNYAFKFDVKEFPNWEVEVVGGILTVSNKAITAADITLEDSSFVYNGEEHTQNVIVTEGITYTVTGNTATNAGKHILTVTGTGNYTGSVDVEWSIARAKVDLTIKDAEVVYGEEIPAVVLEYSDELAEEELNISVVWSAKKGSPVGKYGSSFTWVNYQNWIVDYKGGQLTIVPKTLDETAIELDGALSYTGEEQTQNIKVPEGVSYTVSGNTGTDAGSYTMTVTFTGNYTGTVEVPWTIAKGNVKIEIVNAEITYGDDTPAVEVIYSDANAEGLLRSVKWSAPEKMAPAGSYTASFFFDIDMLSNWAFTVVGGKLTVKPMTITEADIKLGDALTYNGSEQTQEVTLPEGVSYRVVGNSRTNAGNYTMIVIVEGNDNYTGTVEIPWSIAPKDITGAQVTAGDELTYTGSEQTKAVEKVVIDGMEATFKVTGNTGTNAGNYTATITGTGNYTGTVGMNWNIAPKTLTLGDITPSDALTYNGSEQTQNFNLPEGGSYDVSGNTGTNAGDYTATVTASGNYTGSVEVPWSIATKEITAADVALGDALTYTGGEQTKEITTLNGVTATITNNTGTDAGDYTATVTGTGNYRGSVEIPWNIAAKEITAEDITLGEELSYTGSEQTQGFVLPEGYTYEVTGNTGTEVGNYTATITGTGNYTGSVTVEWSIMEDAHPGLYPIYFDAANDDSGTLVAGNTVEIDGVPYVLDGNCIAWVPNTDAKIATTYTYKEGATAYETYPTHMYVWYLTIVDEESDGEYDYYNAERIPELDDFFQYNGTSIRINFSSNGIRFFTSIETTKLNAIMKGELLNGPLAGYTMTGAGTLYKKWTDDGSPIVYGSAAASDVYGGKAGSNFRVFTTADGRTWYTGMLTGLDDNPETLDMDVMSRPFAVLQRGDETIILHGGTIQRSIYYVATQNRSVYASGTAYDNFIENIITTVEEARDNA